MPELCWRIRDGALCRELEGEAVILHLDSGTYFGLNTVGTAIWRLVEQDGRVDAIVDGVVDQYDVSPERARSDVLALMATLVAKGLAEPVS